MLQKKLLHVLSSSPHLRHFTRSCKLRDRRVGTLFFEPSIQGLLKKLSNVDLDQIFTIRKDEEKLEPPQYRFMTDEELQTAMKDAEKRAKMWQQMPPVLDPRMDDVSEICEDPALDGHDEHNACHLFSDVTFGVPEQERLIVVRQPDGVLRHAGWDERQRMYEVYTPRPGRSLIAPPMFQEEHLERLLDRKEYKFILDRACAQYEPNDPEYIRVTRTTYTRVAQEQDFDHLRTTRHFGPLLFYLTFNKEVDSLLLDNLQNHRLEDAVSLVHLYHMMHPDSPSAKAPVGSDSAEIVSAFIELEANKRGPLELALRLCLERLKERKIVTNNMDRIHGIKRG